MEKAMKYLKLIASITALITLIIVGVNLKQMNYRVLAECIIMVICLVVLSVCAAYDFVKKN